MDRESAPLMLDVTAHTHVFGRPSGAWVFDEIMAQIQSRSDVWVTTRKEMADYVLSTTLSKSEWLLT
jgi:hypothetical protein